MVAGCPLLFQFVSRLVQPDRLETLSRVRELISVHNGYKVSFKQQIANIHLHYFFYFHSIIYNNYWNRLSSNFSRCSTSIEHWSTTAELTPLTEDIPLIFL